MGRPFFPDVVVNGRAIAPAEIAAEAQNHSAPKRKPGWAWRKAARALAVRRLLLEEAARRGVAAEPIEFGAGRRETEEEAVIRSLLEQALAIEPPGEKEIRAAYERAPDRYVSPALFEASHILLAAPPGDSAARAAAREKAEAVLAVLRSDPKAFGRLAQSESDCPSRDQAGRLGQFPEGEMVPEFDAALLRLEEGSIAAAPVETRFGLHIVRLDARANGEPLPFEVVRGRIAEALEKTAWARTARCFVARLVAQAEIEGVEFEAAI